MCPGPLAQRAESGPGRCRRPGATRVSHARWSAPGRRGGRPVRPEVARAGRQPTPFFKGQQTLSTRRHLAPIAALAVVHTRQSGPLRQSGSRPHAQPTALRGRSSGLIAGQLHRGPRRAEFVPPGRTPGAQGPKNAGRSRLQERRALRARVSRKTAERSRLQERRAFQAPRAGARCRVCSSRKNAERSGPVSPADCRALRARVSSRPPSAPRPCLQQTAERSAPVSPADRRALKASGTPGVPGSSLRARSSRLVSPDRGPQARLSPDRGAGPPSAADRDDRDGRSG